MMREVGKILRETRVKKGLTIEKIHIETRIPKKYLESLENGAISDFPAEVYFTGSLTRYAKYLGLDSTQYIESYHNMKCIQNQEECDKPQQESDVNALRISSIVIAFCVIGCLYMVYKYKDVIEFSKPVAVKQVETAIPEKKTAELPVQEVVVTKNIEQKVEKKKEPVVEKKVEKPVEPIKLNEAFKKNDAITLEVKAITSSWVKVIADDVIVFEGVMNKPQQMNWSAKKKIALKVGYTAGVDAFVNGSKIDVNKGSKQYVNEINITENKVMSIYE